MHILFYDFTVTPGQDKGGSESTPYPIQCMSYNEKNLKKNSYQDARRASGRKYVLNSNLERESSNCPSYLEIFCAFTFMSPTRELDSY